MNYITPDQFKKHFTVQRDTLAVTPSISLCARSLGHSVDYMTHNTKQFYDTVLVDIPDGYKFPGNKTRYEYFCLKLSLSHVKQDGVIHIKSTSKIIPQIKFFSNLFVEIIEFVNDYVYLKCSIKNNNRDLTTVIYPTGEKILLNTKKTPILYNYNQKHYSYLEQTDLSNSIKRYSLPGKKVRNIENDKHKIKEMGKQGLLIFTNRPSLKVIKLEDVDKLSSAADCHLFDCKEERDKYFNALTTPEVYNFAMNLSHYQPINVETRSYLFNPNIFSLIA